METGWERPCCRSGVSTTVCPVGPHPCSDTGVPAAASCAAASCLLPSSGLMHHLCPACPCFHLCQPYQHCQLLPSPGFAVSIPVFCVSPGLLGCGGVRFGCPPLPLRAHAPRLLCRCVGLAAAAHAARLVLFLLLERLLLPKTRRRQQEQVEEGGTRPALRCGVTLVWAQWMAMASATPCCVSLWSPRGRRAVELHA